MSDAAPAVAAPKKGKRKSGGATKVKKTASHPTYSQMVKMAIQSLKDRKGSSKAAILKYILQNYKVGDNLKSINAHLRMALKRGVTSGKLKQVKGHGASGSFRLAEPAKKPAAPKRPKKTVAKKPKAAKKPNTAKPKKSPAKPKVKKAKSPKKPKSPKKVKTPKKTPKTKTPKKKASPKKKAAKK